MEKMHDLQRRLREAYGIDVEDGAPVPLSGGRVNETLRWGRWVVKRYNHDRVPRPQAERSVRLQAAAAAAGLPVPAPRAAAEGALWIEDDGALVVVMDLAGGERRARGTLSAAEAAEVGHLLARLHRVLREETALSEAAPAPPERAGLARTWSDLYRAAVTVAAPTAFDRLVHRMADYVLKTLPQMPNPVWADQPYHLCHRDFHPDNLLFDEAGGITALLDFDGAGPWWAAAEVMMAWNLTCCPDPGAPELTEAGEAFFRAYREAGLLSPLAWAEMPLIYWFALVSNTWPARLRYREPDRPVPEDWVELLDLRLRAAQWIGENLRFLAQL